MSKAMTPAETIAQLKKWHVPYKATLGWKHRNRAGHGAWGAMHGVLNHHTAGATGEKATDEVRLLKKGRADLPGPLCNFSPARNGVVWLVGWGRANHAGAVRPQVLDRFLNDIGPQKPTGTSGETVDGNAFLYGIETQNDGRGERFTDAQLLSLVLLNAAICDFHRWTPNSVAQHFEVTARKTDMHNIRGQNSGNWLRTEVAVALRAGPGKYTVLGWRPPAPVPALPECTHCCPRHCTKG
jgi:hypothetical protein